MAEIDGKKCKIKDSRPITLESFTDYDRQQVLILHEPKSGDSLTAVTWHALLRNVQKTALVLGNDGKDYYHTTKESDSFTYPLSDAQSFLDFSKVGRAIKSPDVVDRFLNIVLECKDVSGLPVLPESLPLTARDFKNMYDEQQVRGKAR